MRLDWSLSSPEIFVLDEGTEVTATLVSDIGDRWKEIPHARTRTRGYMLLPGDSLLTPPIVIGPDHELALESMRAVQEISEDGLELHLHVETDDGAPSRALTSLAIGNWQAAHALIGCTVSLAAYAGQTIRLRLSCKPGPSHDPRGDWAGVCTWAIAPADRLPLAKASSQYAWRLGNELGNFQDTYTAEMYAEREREAPEATVERSVVQAPGGLHRTDADDREEVLERLQGIQPPHGESVFTFAHRLLYSLLPRRAPDFVARLKQRSNGSRARMLSLCAGEAGVEAALLAKAPNAFELTLLDINATLLGRASQKFSETCTVTLWQGDVRDLGDDAGRFDVISFVSGLHHVVDLEAVLAQCQRLLAPNGELWLIGEQIGRNGNRLWPETWTVADATFRSLPEHLRYNNNTGTHDATLPNDDYGSSCFEGIRSQEIPVVLDRFFQPVDEHMCDCFLWRLVDAAYTPNFDLSNSGDIDYLRRIVAAEYTHWRQGGRATQLNGVYTSKLG